LNTYTVVIAPEAREHLLELYRYIAKATSPQIAADYTSRILAYCESLATAPYRGQDHADIRPGLRITNYRKRAVIAFVVDGNQVAILGIFYGGRDYQAILGDQGADLTDHD
jgi:plasmid stabilization system protein ParE